MSSADELMVISSELVNKMSQQVAYVRHQSIDSLEPHLKHLQNAILSKEILSPYYFVKLPRWLGMDGNTTMESEILVLAHKVDKLVIELNGGIDAVNKLRVNKNKNLPLY